MPKCSNEITLNFLPAVVNTPSWLNKKLRFVLIFLAVWLQINVDWFEINVTTLETFSRLATLCCGGILVVAFADLGKPWPPPWGASYPSVSINSSTTRSQRWQIIATPQWALNSTSPLVPLLMIQYHDDTRCLIGAYIQRLDLRCSQSDVYFMLFLPCATALLLMGMG